MIHEQLVVPKQHGAMQCSTTQADALEQLAILLAAQFETADEARNGFGTIQQRAGSGWVVTSARWMLPDLALLRQFLEHAERTCVRHPQKIAELTRGR